MIEVSVHEAKTQLSHLLNLVQDGEEVMILLDTSALLWTLTDPDRLSAPCSSSHRRRQTCFERRVVLGSGYQGKQRNAADRRPGGL
jgi:antitoxin (DNA-binding transcriptional repressor) of toxin-antitoxin stability system